MTSTALIVGATGIVGGALAERLIDAGWQVYGLARHPVSQPGVTPVSADLTRRDDACAALKDITPEYVFITTWSRQPTEADNIRVNGAMVANLFAAVRPDTLRHAALVTGLKHYLGPFEAYGAGTLPATPFREDQERLDVPNFYYAQEDELFAAAARLGISWSVHRPHTIVGKAIGNAMNMGTTLAVYATLCRTLNRPFRFPGSQIQWDGLTDVTDARLLAEHLLWAATTDAARDQAFNVVNGDVFRWKWMWGQIADWFGIAPAPFDGTVRPLEQQMAGDAAAWREIAARAGLTEPNLERLASPWHTDADLGRPIEVVTDMGKSRRLGFSHYQPSDQSFFDLFARLRSDKLIP